MFGHSLIQCFFFVSIIFIGLPQCEGELSSRQQQESKYETLFALIPFFILHDNITIFAVHHQKLIAYISSVFTTKQIFHVIKLQLPKLDFAVNFFYLGHCDK